MIGHLQHIVTSES